MCTLKMVVFSTPLFTVPALHFPFPRLTLEPIVSESTRYGAPVVTPRRTWRVMNDRSTTRVCFCSSASAVRRTECARTCGSALAECARVGTWISSYRPLALSFLTYAKRYFSCSSLKKRSSCALRIASMESLMVMRGLLRGGRWRTRGSR